MPKVVVAISFLEQLPTARPLPDGLKRPRSCAWQSFDDPDDFLILREFGSEADAQDDLRKVVDAQDETLDEAALPTAVSHVAVEFEQGKVLDDVPLDATLAVAKTVASPGYGHEAAEQMADTVSLYAQLPGYFGHLEGVNESIEEEAWSFMFGSDRWEIPLPADGETSVKMYRRVA